MLRQYWNLSKISKTNSKIFKLIENYWLNIISNHWKILKHYWTHIFHHHFSDTISKPLSFVTLGVPLVIVSSSISGNIGSHMGNTTGYTSHNINKD